MAERIYPKAARTRNRHLTRRWVVNYEQMVCEGGGITSWSKGYRTRRGALVAAWFWQHFGTYGGIVTIERGADR